MDAVNGMDEREARISEDTLAKSRIRQEPELCMKKIGSSNAEYDIRTSDLYRSVLPLFRSLMICGLFNTRLWSPSGGYRKRDKREWRSIMSQAYSTTILVVLWLNMLRIFSIFIGENTFGYLLFLKVTIVIWHLICTVGCTVMLAACNRRRNNIWEYLYRCLECSMSEGMLCVRRRVGVMTALAWISVLLNMACGFYGFFFTTVFDPLLAPFHVYVQYAQIARIVYFVIFFYLISAWVFPLAFLYAVSCMLSNQFRFDNEIFRKKVREDAGVISCHTIREHRRRHNDLCKLTTVADNMMNAYVGCTVGAKSVFLCLMMYNAIWYSEYVSDSMVFIVTLFWLCIGLTVTGLILICGALVNHRAHASYTDLHDLNLEGVTSETALQVTMLLNRLSGSSIGLTALKMFVIDKPTILTLLGMLLTYFVLILQFAPGFSSSSSSSSACNCTEFILNNTLHCYVTSQ
ncbi:hypothetical protein LSH36_203g01052 [Paralvinella palmiformis]|uniref:Gustatory receptor n=1 Tax=Paralvinella palmiformis TaxID=53620 RepID=A0AAD9N4W0_9ANNE|nr:hypothetical protein LSH36_203g01052 [Paralvinella palmiformis]